MGIYSVSWVFPVAIPRYNLDVKQDLESMFPKLGMFLPLLNSKTDWGEPDNCKTPIPTSQLSCDATAGIIMSARWSLSHAAPAKLFESS